MMRSIFFLVFCPLFFLQAFCQSGKDENSFFLAGNLKGIDTGIIILLHPEANGQYVKDTTHLNKGLFQFTGKVLQPSFCWLIEPGKNRNTASFFLEPGQQEITLEKNKFEDFIMAGSFTQKQSDTLSSKLKAIEMKYKEWIEERSQLLNQLQKAADSTKKINLEKKLFQIDERNKIVGELKIKEKVLFISQHPDSYASPTELYGLIT